MATLTTKYNNGDTVYHAACHSSETWIECPDCKGELKWIVTFADGHQEEVPCQTCQYGYSGPYGSVKTYEYKPSVATLTIGQVRFDEDGPRYMCHETGIGSGTVYYERNLFDNVDEAQVAAQEMYVKQMAHLASINFRKKGEFARSHSTFGYSRAEALKNERTLHKWIELINNPATQQKDPA